MQGKEFEEKNAAGRRIVYQELLTGKTPLVGQGKFLVSDVLKD